MLFSNRADSVALSHCVGDTSNRQNGQHLAGADSAILRQVVGPDNGVDGNVKHGRNLRESITLTDHINTNLIARAMLGGGIGDSAQRTGVGEESAAHNSGIAATLGRIGVGVKSGREERHCLGT